jgi:hypothetical protein
MDARLTMLYKIDRELVAISKTDQQEDYDNLTTMPIKYHTVGLTSGRCRSSQELSEIGTPCHLTKPAWTHLKVSNFNAVGFFLQADNLYAFFDWLKESYVLYVIK